MSRAIVATLAACACAAAVPGVAHAKTYRGKTSQGKAAVVVTGADGVVTRARIAWRAPCGQNKRYVGSTSFRAPLDAATGDLVQDAGTYRTRVRGYTARITIAVAGLRDPATDRWSGTLAVKVKVKRNGKLVDRCSASKLTWKAK
jgi:hypothetical protein